MGSTFHCQTLIEIAQTNQKVLNQGVGAISQLRLEFADARVQRTFSSITTIILRRSTFHCQTLTHQGGRRASAPVQNVRFRVYGVAHLRNSCKR